MLRSVGNKVCNQLTEFVQPENKADKEYLELSVVETAAVCLEAAFGPQAYYGTLAAYSFVKIAGWQSENADENDQNEVNSQR